MDRIIEYPGAIPQDSDDLNTNRNTLLALGYALQAMFGTGTLVDGLACTPTGPASMSVLVGNGSIISLQTVDTSAYGSLPTTYNSQALVKMGINWTGPVTFTFTAPGTVGFSQNSLIQAEFSEVDTDPVVLPYYNASNPNVPYSGPGNSGTPQNTTRPETVSLVVKPGTPAATGTQVTPTPDAGFVGLWVITTTNGVSTITSGNIAQYSGAPFITQKNGKGSLIGVQTHSTSGTYTPSSPLVRTVLAKVYGSGGGGGGAATSGGGNGSAAGGGSGGSYGEVLFAVGEMSGQAYTIGGGGGGGAIAGAGSNGANSVLTGVTTTLTVPGGVGGAAGPSATPIATGAAAASGGTPTISGANMQGIYLAAGEEGGIGTVFTSSQSVGGKGGANGRGGGGGNTGNNTVGGDSPSPGGGGGGAASTTGTGYIGGNGGGGGVEFWEYA